MAFLGKKRILESIAEQPIVLVVGPNGSGKTLLTGVICRMHLEENENATVRTVVTRDYPGVQRMEKVKELLEAPKFTTFELDELAVHGFDSRDRMPTRLRRHFMQLRKRKHRFIGTAPSIDHIEKTLRQMSFMVVDVRGILKKQVEGTPWRAPRYVYIRTYEMQGVSRLPDDGNRRPKPRDWSYVPLKYLVEMGIPYDAEEEVVPLSGVNKLGLCVLCGGTPPGPPRCSCDDDENKKTKYTKKPYVPRQKSFAGPTVLEDEFDPVFP